MRKENLQLKDEGFKQENKLRDLEREN